MCRRLCRSLGRTERVAEVLNGPDFKEAGELMMSSTTFNAAPTGAALGAEISGVDLGRLGDAEFQRIHQAWLDHEVLLFRDQQLADSDLIAFSKYMGVLEQAPIQESGRRFVDGYPEIYVVSNVIENDVPIGSLGSGEAVWHTDMSYLPDPPIASVLYALEIPASGGDTGFCTMTGAYAALPSELRDRIKGLRVKHDGTYNSGGYVREGVTPTDDPRVAPGTIHPLVCIHPETEQRALYLGRRRNAHIEGLSIEDSEVLLDEIWALATRDELTWQHSWRPGDLVMWDNRSTMHRRNAFDPGLRRIMHRTQIKGDVAPIPALD
jgi:taurine dioxygenase